MMTLQKYLFVLSSKCTGGTATTVLPAVQGSAGVAATAGPTALYLAFTSFFCLAGLPLIFSFVASCLLLLLLLLFFFFIRRRIFDGIKLKWSIIAYITSEQASSHKTRFVLSYIIIVPLLLLIITVISHHASSAPSFQHIAAFLHRTVAARPALSSCIRACILPTQQM